MLESLKARAASEGVPWQPLVKEALQVLFLEVFCSLPESSKTTFRGGTCLRLLYGGPRHSEDLDFVTSEPLGVLDRLRAPVLQRLRPQEALLQGSLELSAQKSYSKILRWKLKWIPAEGRERVFVRVELARYPAYTRELKPLSRPPGLPSGPWVVVPAETREEILADKLAAIAGRPYLKGRDFFDLWLLRSQGIRLDHGMLKKKLADYGGDKKGLMKRLAQADAGFLKRDLSAFLPAAVRRPLEEEDYRSVLRAAKDMISSAHKALPG